MPPLAVTVMVVVPPLHNIAGAAALAVAGPFVLLIEAVVEKIHPLASFTSIVWDVAARLLYTSVLLNADPFTE